MFPFIRDSGPFLNLLPFPTAGSGFVTVTNGTVSISGTQITLPATSSGSLVGAVYGVEFGIGVSAGYVWSENVAGAASSQTITIDISTYGGTTSSTVNARTYYNLDPLDAPATRVYSAMLVPLVNSASINDTTPTEGDTLTGSAGIIVGGYPMTLTQAWQQCDSGGANCSAIGGATATTYLVTSGNVGNTLKYQQTATNSAGSGSATSAATSVVASGLNPATQAVINAYASTPSGARQILMNNMVQGLIDDGVWTLLDSLYITAAPAEADTYINWKNPGTNNLTKTGTVTHSADVSMTGNGTTGRLTCSTKFNDASFSFAQNSAHIMVWTTGTAANAFTCGSDDTITNTARVVLTADNSFGSATFRVNTPNSSAGKATVASTGFFLVQRTAAAVSQAYQNGSTIGTADTDSSTGECDGKFTLCAGYTTAWAYSTVGIKAGSFGPQLSGAQITALYNRLNTYLGAI